MSKANLSVTVWSQSLAGDFIDKFGSSRVSVTASLHQGLTFRRWPHFPSSGKHSKYNLKIHLLTMMQMTPARYYAEFLGVWSNLLLTPVQILGFWQHAWGLEEQGGFIHSQPADRLWNWIATLGPSAFIFQLYCYLPFISFLSSLPPFFSLFSAFVFPS